MANFFELAYSADISCALGQCLYKGDRLLCTLKSIYFLKQIHACVVEKEERERDCGGFICVGVWVTVCVCERETERERERMCVHS